MSRPKIHWFKKGFYLFLKQLVLLIDKIYYEKMTIVNKEGLLLDKPAIVVSNHPSTMMDPVNVAARVNRYVHFLANAGLFQTSFTNWFFSTFFCFPVQRKKDIGKRQINNQQSFQKSFQFLADGGCLFIAPEGVSTPEHDLKPLKTGTARIALGAEKTFNNTLQLEILPVGIYYEDAQLFRSKVIMVVGEPIVVSEWSAAFAENERAASLELTEHLQQRLETLIVDVDGLEQDEQLRDTEKIINAIKELSPIDQYKRTKKVADQIREKNFPLTEEVQSCTAKMDALGLMPKVVFGGLRLKWWHLLLPFALLGWLANIIPLLLIFGLEKLANLYKGYTSTLRTLSGAILLPIFYRLNNGVLNNLVLPNWEIGFWWPLFWYAYILLGLFAFYYFRSLWRGWKRWRWQNEISKSPEGATLKVQALNLQQQLTPYTDTY